VGWHYTCPLRGSARAVPYEIGGTRDTTVRERRSVRTRLRLRLADVSENRTVCSVALAGWMVWWYTVISRLMILRRYTKTSVDAPNNVPRLGCASCKRQRRDGSAVFTVRLRPRAL
jgi:hypothetical protein